MGWHNLKNMAIGNLNFIGNFLTADAMTNLLFLREDKDKHGDIAEKPKTILWYSEKMYIIAVQRMLITVLQKIFLYVKNVIKWTNFFFFF